MDSCDEQRHEAAPVEAWWFWGWLADGSAGLYVGFELRGRRFDYWAGLVRAGHPYVHVVELDGRGLRGGLEIKPERMWADHVCDEPFRQWSIGSEAYGVALDDPGEALGRAYGEPVPVAFDVEWYATEPPRVIEDGYVQDGEVDAQIELRDGRVAIVGPATRVHVWGTPWLPVAPARPTGWGLRAPYRRHDGLGVEQLLTATGWAGWAVPTGQG